MSTRDWLVVSNMFYFHPETWGRMFTHFDIHMFQKGLNLQPPTFGEKQTAPSFSVFLPPFFSNQANSMFHPNPPVTPNTRQQQTPWNPEAWTGPQRIGNGAFECGRVGTFCPKRLGGEGLSRGGNKIFSNSEEGWGFEVVVGEGSREDLGPGGEVSNIFLIFLVFSPRKFGEDEANLTHIVSSGLKAPTRRCWTWFTLW